MKSTSGRALLLLVGIFGCNSKAPEPPALGVLTAGAPMQKRLLPGESHRYTLALVEPQIAELSLEQRGVDLRLSCVAEGALTMGVANHRHSSLGTESMVLDLPAGTYSVVVEAVRTGAPAGDYLLGLRLDPPDDPRAKARAAADEHARQGAAAWAALKAERIAAAEQSYEAAQAAWTELGDDRRLAEAEQLRCQIAHRQGHAKVALERCIRARLMAERAHDVSLETRVRVDLAEIYGEIGDTERSRPLALGAVATTATLGDTLLSALAHGQLGLNYLEAGESALSLAELEKAKAIAEPTLELPLLMMLYGNLGGAWMQVGDTAKMKAAFTQAVSLGRRCEDRRTLGRALHGLGVTASDFEDDLNAAHQHFEEAAQLLRETGDQEGAARSLDALGTMESSLGDPKAIERHLAALELQRSIGSLRFDGQTLTSLAAAYARLDRPAEAIEPLERAIKLLQQARAQNDEAYAWFRLARAQDKLGNYPKAIAAAEQSLQISEGLRERLASDEARAYYSAGIRWYFDTYVASAMKSYRQSGDRELLELGFRVAEQARSRSLLDMLALVKVKPSGVSSEALAKLDRLRTEFRELDARQKRALVLGEDGSLLEQALTEKLGAYEREHLLMTRADPRAAQLLRPPRSTLKDAARLLDPDTVLLQFHLGSNGCYVWAVGSSTAAGYALGKEQPITGLARQLHQHLTARNERPPSESAEARARRIEKADVASTTTARALSELVLWPAARAIAGKKRVVIAADGALHFVPFLMLPDPNAPEEPLIAGHEVLSIPSISVLAAVRGKSAGGAGAAGKKLVLLADPVFEAHDERITKAGTATVVAALEPIRGVDGKSLGRLPSSRAEAEAIAALVQGPNRRVLLDFEANRQAVLGGALADGRIIHFATHGLLDAAHPEGSGLVLSSFDAGGRPIEGTLRLVDIYGLHLNAELVTLSACETALGREIRGEGLIGLTRGFLHAGARRVIASLWKVSDRATSELMVELYRSLMGEGSGASAALRNAVLRVRQDPKYRAPYYWAAFELQGDWAR